MDAKSRKTRYGKAELYIYRPGQEATTRISKKKLINNVPKPANKKVIKNRIHILLSFNK